MFKKLVFAFLIMAVGAIQSNPLSAAGKKADVEILTQKFGTAVYQVDNAVQTVFSELKESNLNVRTKQTPGAMYPIRTWHGLRDKLDAGAVAHIAVGTTDAITEWSVAGRPPFDKFPLPEARVLWGTLGYIKVFVTFDKNIKTPADLIGKKVGVEGKANIFAHILPNKPYFDKNFGGYNKVKWQYLGDANAKDALLSGSVDAAYATFVTKLAKDKQGRVLGVYAHPTPPLMELMSSGRKLYFVDEDPDIIKKTYVQGKYMMTPMLIIKGALKGVDKALWVRGVQGAMAVDATMPDEVAEEMVLTAWKNMKRLADYSKMFLMYADSPYPVNVPKQIVHPGTISATLKLGFKVPDN
ncbi:MAG: ABC transporter substrate-binding protein [Deltaproteobacteria bacterium]|nr:ABC transporter substrate-binding protein [Deltaproteobacteria bacterium]